MRIEKIINDNFTLYILNSSDAQNCSEEYCRLHFPERFLKSEKYKHIEDRQRCICAGVLLFEVLGLEDCDIVIGEHGKPESNKIKEKFSLSHSGDYVVLAVGEKEIGVDVERIDRKYIDIMDRVLTEDEKSWVLGDRDKTSTNSEEKRGHSDKGKDAELSEKESHRFMQIWTLKESVSKALGLGLGLEFKAFSVLELVNGGCVYAGGHKCIGSSIEKNEYAISAVTLE